MPTSMRKQTLLAAGLGSALAGCLSSEPSSNLNTDGDPRVVTVTIYSESAVAADSHLGMDAIYCSNNAGDKVSEAYCPADGAVTDAWPLDWQMWVVFNELLIGEEVETTDGNIGVLKDGIVSLTCGGEELVYGADFSGWYDPSGSHLTLPIGPAIVIDPGRSVAATGAGCELSINASSVHDKQGNPVGESDPFTFQIAPMRLASELIEGVHPTDPDGGAEDVELDASPIITFNALVDPDSVAGKIQLLDAEGNPVEVSLAVPDNEAKAMTVVLTPTAPLAAGADYKIVVSSGIKDIRGGELVLDAPYEATFTTVAQTAN